MPSVQQRLGVVQFLFYVGDADLMVVQDGKATLFLPNAENPVVISPTVLYGGRRYAFIYGFSHTKSTLWYPDDVSRIITRDKAHRQLFDEGKWVKMRFQ